MILLIDNYDSFSYNLVQMVGALYPDIQVVRNDAIAAADIASMDVSHLILSPGPGKPADAGICEDVIRMYQGKLPILGICLGHQAICEVCGATVSLAKQLIHGKSSDIHITHGCELFEGLPPVIRGARYHSLVALRKTIPPELQIIAQDDSGEVMAVKHKDCDMYGLQFHPESILTSDGAAILKNFLRIGGKIK